MAAEPLEKFGISRRLAIAGRKFNAWWEGYAFDPEIDGAADPVAATGGQAGDIERFIGGLIWGAGRTEPGDPAWTMRHARTLGLAPRARVVVLGAGAGGPLRDLKSGARWKVAGLSHLATRAPGLDLKTYDAAMMRLSKGDAEGALCLFELHREPDPAAIARVAAELVRPGAPAAFVDFAVPRKTTRLRSCFTNFSPRIATDYVRCLKEAGFAVSDTVDETRNYTPLIARGWANWRRAYDAASSAKDARMRSDMVCFLADYAHLWAERLDALRSGQLQVIKLQARKMA